MAEFESPKKKKTPRKKKEDSEDLSESKEIKLKEKSPSLKRKTHSSSDDGGAIKKPKEDASKVNGEVDSFTYSKWTLKEEEDLLDKVEEYLMIREDAEGTKKPIYMKSIEWSKIDCGEHTSKDAQHRFLVISNRVRKMRTAREILKDMKQVHSKSVSSAKKKEVDPDLPKKPNTPYIKFSMEKRHGIIERHPELKGVDVTRKLGSKWKKLSEEKKKKYLDRYHDEMESYTSQIIDYLKSHNPDVSPPKVKFELWAEEEKKKIKESRPDISEKKLAKKLKRRWENMEEEERTKWEEEEKRELKRFRDRIARAKNKNNTGQKVGSSSEEKSDA